MALLDEVKARLDIVDLVSEHVPLKKAGRNFKASCPFHAERTPSFFVFPQRQTWRCFGACATGGDVIAFVQRIENLEFGDALRRLAQRAGVALPERRRPEAQQAWEQRLLQANEAAARFFQDTLASSQGDAARAYLAEREVSPQATESFGLGLAPNRWDAVKQHLQAQGYAEEALLEAGLLTRLEDGRIRDLFRHRLVFPIRDGAGRLVGFGGRALDDATPKYLNTPQTPLFEKGRLLYGLDKAMAQIRQQGEGVIVEGYMDVIAAHQRGFTNVVASMGTALTEHQVALLRGLAPPSGSGQPPRFVLALDADTAGREATRRSLESSWRVLEREVGHTSRRGLSLVRRSTPAELRIALLPEGRDPDQVLRKDPERWRAIVAQAAPLIDFLITDALRRHDLSSGQGKAALAEEVFPLIAALDNPYDQDRYFRRLADLLGVSVAALEASVGRPGRRRPPSQRAERPRASASPLEAASHDPLEEYTLALLLRHPQLRLQAEGLREEHFRRSENREVFTLWIKCSTLQEVKEQMTPELETPLERVLAREFPFANTKERDLALAHCLRRLEERRLRELKEEETLALEQEWAHSPDPQEVLTHLNLEATERLRQLFQEGAQRPRSP